MTTNPCPDGQCSWFTVTSHRMDDQIKTKVTATTQWSYFHSCGTIIHSVAVTICNYLTACVCALSNFSWHEYSIVYQNKYLTLWLLAWVYIQSIYIHALVERTLSKQTGKTLPQVMDVSQWQPCRSPRCSSLLCALCSLRPIPSILPRSSSHSPLTWPRSLSLSTIKCPRQRWAFHYLSANSLATEQVLER